jgi:hypothetical protein
VSEIRAAGAALVPVVTEYMAAFNARDIDGVVALVADDYRFTAPHATVEGPEGLREFIDRQRFGAGLRVRHRRFFARDDIVVTDDLIEYVSADSGEVLGSDDGVAVFSFRDRRIADVTLHSDLHTALRSAGMTEDDLVG